MSRPPSRVAARSARLVRPVVAFLLAACSTVPPAALFDVGARDAARATDAGRDGGAEDGGADVDTGLDAGSMDAATDAHAAIDGATRDAGLADGGAPRIVPTGVLIVGGQSPSTASCAETHGVVTQIDVSTRAVMRVACDGFDTLGVASNGAVWGTENARMPCAAWERATTYLSGSVFVPAACSPLDFVELGGQVGSSFVALIDGRDDCAHFGAPAVAFLDAPSGTVGRRVCGADWFALPNASQGYLAIEPAGTVLFATTVGGPASAIERIDPATGSITRVATIASPDTVYAIAVAPDGRIFAGLNGGDASCFRGRIARIDAATGALAETICESRPWAPYAMVASADGNTLYVADTYTTACGSQGGILIVDISAGHFAIADVLCDADIFRPDTIALR